MDNDELKGKAISELLDLIGVKCVDRNFAIETLKTIDYKHIIIPLIQDDVKKGKSLNQIAIKRGITKGVVRWTIRKLKRAI